MENFKELLDTFNPTIEDKLFYYLMLNYGVKSIIKINDESEIIGFKEFKGIKYKVFGNKAKYII